MTSLKEARETKIYFVDIKEESLFINSMTEAEFIMLSVDETTSPRGVEPRLHIRSDNYYDGHFRANGAYPRENGDHYEVWTWGVTGNHPQFIEKFDTEEEAEDFIFQQTYHYFLNDFNRPTQYFYSEAEAIESMKESYSGMWNVSLETIDSILHHQDIARKIQDKREQERIIRRQVEQDRQEKIAAEYAKMIEPVTGESYRETAARLSAAIGERIESSVFHKAVKIIRSK